MITELKRQTTGHRILKYLTIFGSIEAMTVVCSVVRNKLVAVFIGVTGVGLLGLFSNALELLSSFTQMGLRMSAVKEISATEESRRHAAIIAVHRLSGLLAIAALLISLICAPLLSYISFGSTNRTWAFMLLSLAVLFNLITASRSAILQAVTRLKPIARASAVSTVLSLVISVPLIIYLRIDAIIPMILVYSGVNMTAFLFINVSYTKSNAQEQFSTQETHRVWKRILHLGLFLMISGLVTWLANYLVLSYMNYAGGPGLMGYYQSGYTLTIRYTGIIFTAMSMEYFPRIAACGNQNIWRMSVMVRHQAIFSMAVVSLLACIMMLCAPFVVTLLYSSEFSCIVPLLILAAPGLLLRVISWSMAYMILAKGDGRIFLITESISATLSLLLNIAGYTLAGIAGIGISFTLWYALYALIIRTVVVRRYGFRSGPRMTAWFCSAMLLLLAVSALSLYLYT